MSLEYRDGWDDGYRARVQGERLIYVFPIDHYEEAWNSGQLAARADGY